MRPERGYNIEVNIDGKIIRNCQDCPRICYHDDYGTGMYKGCVSLECPIPTSGIREDCPYIK